MIQLNQIIVLLQLVLALLSNPATANDPSVQALIPQVISSAQQAISSFPATKIVPDSQTPQSNTIPPVNTSSQPSGSGPDLVILATTPVEKSCSLVGTYLGSGNVDLEWTLNGMDQNTPGNLYFENGPEPNPLHHAVSLRAIYKAVFGESTCYAFFKNAYTPDLKVGDVSTATNPFKINP